MCVLRDCPIFDDVYACQAVVNIIEKQVSIMIKKLIFIHLFNCTRLEIVFYEMVHILEMRLKQ